VWQEATHEACDCVLVDHARADGDGLRGVHVLYDPADARDRERARARLWQREDARLRHGDGHVRRDRATGRYLQLPRPGARRGRRRQHNRARHLPRAADDKYTPARFLVAARVGRRQRPATQQTRRDKQRLIGGNRARALRALLLHHALESR